MAQVNLIVGLPDTIQYQLLQQLDEAGKLSLFQTCRASRDLVRNHCRSIRFKYSGDNTAVGLLVSTALRPAPIHLTLVDGGSLDALVRSVRATEAVLNAVRVLAVERGHQPSSWIHSLHLVFPAVTDLTLTCQPPLAAGDMASIALMQNMTHLRLSPMGPTDPSVFHELAAAPQLTNLTLTSLTGAVAAGFGALATAPRLTSLTLNTPAPDALGHLVKLGTSLTELRLISGSYENLRLTSAEATSFFLVVSMLHGLKRLYADVSSGETLTTEHVEPVVGGCASLEELALPRSKVDMGALMCLTGKPHLTNLSVYGVTPSNSDSWPLPPSVGRQEGGLQQLGQGKHVQLHVFCTIDVRVAARLPATSFSKLHVLSLGVPEGIPADVAVAELAAAATNLGCRWPAQGSSWAQFEDGDVGLTVYNNRAARSNLPNLLLALAPLAPHCKELTLEGPDPVTQPLAQQDAPFLSDTDGESDDVGDDIGDGMAGIVQEKELTMVLRSQNLDALGQVLPGLKHLSLLGCRLASDFLPSVCHKLPKLVRLQLGFRTLGAVAGSDLAAFCVGAPRDVVLEFSCCDAAAREGALSAKRTLKHWPHAKGKFRAGV